MSISITPQEGIYIQKEFNVNEDFDERKVFKVTNNGNSTIYLVYPDLSSVKGIRFFNRPATGRTPDIEPGGSQLVIIEVAKEYINKFNTLGQIDRQILKFKVVGYAPDPQQPPEGPAILYYLMSVDPVDETANFTDNRVELNNDQLQVNVGVRLIAVYDDGTRETVVPDNDFKFEANTITDGDQMRIVNSDWVGNIWVVTLENLIGGQLDSTWIASTRDPKYVNQAGLQVSYKVNFFSEGENVDIPTGTPDDPDSPTDSPDSPEDDPTSTPTSGGGGGTDPDSDDSTRLL